MIVTFCGHKTIYGHEDSLRQQLYDVLNSILKNTSEQETPLTLYCGGYGGFDSLRISFHRTKNGTTLCASSMMRYFIPPLKPHPIALPSLNGTNGWSTRQMS